VSDLTEFRDHARTMAARTRLDLLPEPGGRCQMGAHTRCLIGSLTCPCSCHDSDRPVVPTEAERALWARLADEVDTYLGVVEAVDAGLFAEGGRLA
jgi:hypothetical protein